MTFFSSSAERSSSLVKRVVQEAGLVGLAGADRLVVQGADDRAGVVPLVELQPRLVGLQVGRVLDLLGVVGGHFEEEARGAPGDQVFAQGLVQGAAESAASLLGAGDDEVEIGIADRLEEVGQGEPGDAVALAVGDQQDARVSAGRLVDELPGDVSGSLGEVGEGLLEEALDVVEAPAVVARGASP